MRAVPQVAPEAETRRLIDRGLDRYERGELRDALAQWELALAGSPGHPDASALVEFARALLTEGARRPGQERVPVEGGLRKTAVSPVPGLLAPLTAPDRARAAVTPAQGIRVEPEGAFPAEVVTDRETQPVASASGPVLELEVSEAASGEIGPVEVGSWDVDGFDVEGLGALAAGPRVVSTREIAAPAGMLEESTEPVVSVLSETNIDFEEAGTETWGGADEDLARRARRHADGLVELCRGEVRAGHFAAAASLAEQALALREDAPAAWLADIVEPARALFEQAFEAHIGPPETIFVPAVSLEALAGQELDARAGFLLSRIDGPCSFEQIADATGMPPFDVLRGISSLLRLGALEATSGLG